LAENISQIQLNSEIAFDNKSTIFFDELALAIINILRTDCEQDLPIQSKLILVKILRKLIEI